MINLRDIDGFWSIGLGGPVEGGLQNEAPLVSKPWPHLALMASVCTCDGLQHSFVLAALMTLDRVRNPKALGFTEATGVLENLAIRGELWPVVLLKAGGRNGLWMCISVRRPKSEVSNNHPGLAARWERLCWSKVGYKHGSRAGSSPPSLEKET